MSLDRLETSTLPVAGLTEIGRMLPNVLFRCYKKADGNIYGSLNEGGLAQQFGLTTKEIEGKSLEQLFPGGSSSALYEHFEDAFRGKPTVFTNEIEGRHFRHFPQPVFDDDGKVTEVVGFIADVTELVVTQEAIVEANKELETFAYTASHDFRGPLSTLRMDSSVLMKRLDEGTLEWKAAKRIQNSSDRLANMVEGLLQLRRAYQETLDLRSVNISSIAGSLVAQLTRRDPERNVTWDIEGELFAEGDEPLVDVLMQNLLENAWKFTADQDKASISVRAGANGSIEVTDNGPGFEEKDAIQVFEAFTRLTRDKPGSGIGLATVKRIIERHGGHVEAEGHPGEGATFRFSLPKT
jgi:PAS domain S-box-containing protein